MAGSTVMRPLLLLLLAASLLSACGKKGAPEPPGPPNEITWPRTYPTH
jgi:predicted small lipoprotein YifL